MTEDEIAALCGGRKAAKRVFASRRGHYCRNPNCGDWIEDGQSHSFALGPLAGHYCFGCEPAGHPCQTVPKQEAAPRAE